jgi:hypothetical protein
MGEFVRSAACLWWGARARCFHLDPGVVEGRPAAEPADRVHQPLGMATVRGGTTSPTRPAASAPGFGDSDERLLEIALDSNHPHVAGKALDRLRREGWARLNLPEPWLPYAGAGFPTASGRAELPPGGAPPTSSLSESTPTIRWRR